MSDPATTPWRGEDLDLPAYLARIGYAGPVQPTPEVLRCLMRAHTTTIPFENLEVILGRAVPLDLASLQDKIVARRRGGYCYENATLFAAALERIGFGVSGLSGRVTMGVLASGAVRPATHALLRVTTRDDPRVWVCDTGFGFGPLAPYELAASAGEFGLGDWRYRLELRADSGQNSWVLYQLDRNGWTDRYVFTENPQYTVDYVVGNHFVSTSPRSPFTMRPYVQRFRPDAHFVIDDLTFTAEYPDGRSQQRELLPDELPEMLARVFDIELDAADSAALQARSWPGQPRS